jgi:hypothetical protein
MKKHLFSQSASCDIMFEKVSGRRIQPPKRSKSADLYVLYIIYISNGNNDAMTQSNRDGGFLRVIIRVIDFFLPITTRFENPPRHYPHTIERASNLCPTRADIHALCPTQAPSFSFQISNTGASQ